MEKERDKEMSSDERETNELHYHGWLEDIYKEIRNVHLKSSSNPANVYKIMDKFIEYLRAYFCRNPQEKSEKMNDYYLARATNRLMFLFRDFITKENDHEYLLKISELLGGCTALWLRYYSTEDRQYGETHIESILNCYDLYLQSTTDESFLLKVFAHVLFANRKLPQLFSKVLEKHLKKRAQRKGQRYQEVKEDQLYILYIIGFKLWDDLRPKGDISNGDIPKYANDFIKPMTTILFNDRYARYLPSITSSDIEDGEATRIILTKFQSRYLYNLAEAVVKEDWLRSSDMNTPIFVDLSIEEQLEMNKVDSVGPELKSLSLDGRNPRLSKELWWVEILQEKVLKTLKNEKENYKVVETIELDYEEKPETKKNIVTENVIELNMHSTIEAGKDIPNDLKSKALNQNEKDNINENEIFTQTELKHENINKRDERLVVQDEETNVEIISEKEQNVINLDMPIIQEKEMNKKGMNHDEDDVIETEKDVVTIETERIDKEMVKEVKKQCKGDSMNQDTKKNTEKKNKGRMDIEVEEKNEVTSKDNANKLVPTAKTSGKLSSEITLSDESTSKTFVQDSKSEAPNSPEVCTSEVRKLCSKLITLDIQEHFKNRLDMEEEIEKRVNEIVSKEANNAESQENLCDDEKPLSIICIEDTRPKSPLLLTDTSENEMESATKSEIKIIEGNTSTTNENLVIDESLNHTCTPKSPQTSETVKYYQGNNKGSSDLQLDIGIDNDSHKDCLNKITPDKENARNTNTPEIPENEGTTPHSTDDEYHMSIWSIADESETYDNVDPKVDDVHFEKISPHRTEETTVNSEKSTPGLFSVATIKKLSPLSEYPDNFQEEPEQNHCVVSTSTANVRQKRSASPNYAFFPSPEHYQLRYPTEIEEIKSPPVESFTKSDTEEFKKLFNKSYTETNCVEKDSCSDQDEPVSNAYPNFMSERTSQRVPKRSILSKTDGHIQSDIISSSTKRKAVSFATITQEMPPLYAVRDMNLGSTILERKEQEQELDILSTSGINCFGSASPPLIKDSGMTQNIFQFENDSELPDFNDDAVGSNAQILHYKSCESDYNLDSATDLPTNSGSLKVKTNLMGSDFVPSLHNPLTSELNIIEDESINMLFEYVGDECDDKLEEKKVQYSLPLKKRRTLSRDGVSIFDEACKESNIKKSFEYYDYEKSIACPTMSILQVFDEEVTLLVNSKPNNTIAIINAPSQQTILTDGRGFNVISQQKGIPQSSSGNIYTNIPLQTDINNFSEGMKLNAESVTSNNTGGNVSPNLLSPNKLNNLLSTENIYNNSDTMYNQNVERSPEINTFDYSLNSNYLKANTQRNTNQNGESSKGDLNNLTLSDNQSGITNNPQGGGNIGQTVGRSTEMNKFSYPANTNIIQNMESSGDINKYNSATSSGVIAHNSKRNINENVRPPNDINKYNCQLNSNVGSHNSQINMDRQRKSKKFVTERITRGSNRTISVNCKDDGVPESKSLKRKRTTRLMRVKIL